jgi:hypothetical protein
MSTAINWREGLSKHTLPLPRGNGFGQAHEKHMGPLGCLQPS